MAEHPLANDQRRTEARRVKHNAAGRKYYAVHREEVRARNREWREKNGLLDCVKCQHPAGPLSRILCEDHRKRNVEANRRYRRRVPRVLRGLMR